MQHILNRPADADKQYGNPVGFVEDIAVVFFEKIARKHSEQAACDNGGSIDQCSGCDHVVHLILRYSTPAILLNQ